MGIGTVFRHFPTKEALLEAVYVARLRTLGQEAEALASGANPGEAFFGFFARVVGYAATKNALSAALMEAGVDVSEAAAETGQGLKRALATLLSRAQEAGAVRRDVGPGRGDDPPGGRLTGRRAGRRRRRRTGSRAGRHSRRPARGALTTPGGGASRRP